MIFGRIPIISTERTFREILLALARMRDPSVYGEFTFSLARLLQAEEVHLVSSGSAAFLLILQVLKEQSARREVVLPAYTSSSLVVAIQEAGLRPVLCDISLEDFNLDADALMDVVSQDTLAVVCVHMFGIGMRRIKDLREKLPADIAIIEDCAQAMGSKIEGSSVGIFGEAGFLSFGRGKNMPLVAGGAVVTRNDAFAVRLNRFLGLEGIHFGKCVADTRIVRTARMALQAGLMVFVTHPVVYACVYPVITMLRKPTSLSHIHMGAMTAFQAALGLIIARRIEQSFVKRHNSGMYLHKELQGIRGLRLPVIEPSDYPVFCRFPLLVEDPEIKKKMERALFRGGIDSPGMYDEPLHHMFELGYAKGDFTNATFLARHLLTLPVHPQVTRKDLTRMVGIVVTCVQSCV